MEEYKSLWMEERKKSRIQESSLKRREDVLFQREIELNEKQQEFEKITHGHIYSTNKEVIETEIKNEQKSISKRMRELKDSFDNDEITYEEYKIQRQKLLEEE